MENELLTRYMQFTGSLNENIASTIQLMNNLRFNVFEICDTHLHRQPPTRLTFPVNLPLPRLSERRRPARRSDYITGRSRPHILSRRAYSSGQRQNQLPSLVTTPIFTRFRPTSDQITAATTTSAYCDISTNHTTCPISRTQFNENDRIMQIQRCQHVFMEESLREWFRTSSECPMCRYNISESASINSLTPLFTQAVNTLGQAVRDASTNTILQDFSGTIFGDISGNGPSRIEYTFQWPT